MAVTKKAAAKKKPAVKKTTAAKPAPKKAPTKKPRTVSIPAAPQILFLDRNRRVFILLDETEGSARYLARLDEEIKVVTLKKGEPVRDDKGTARPETHCTDDLRPYPEGNATQALKSFWASRLPKSNAAIRELCRLLDMPVPEVAPEVKARRKAAGERLKAAKPARVGFTIQQLCEKLKIEPSDARKALRKAKVEKPEAGWVWPTEAEAMAVWKSVK